MPALAPATVSLKSQDFLPVTKGPDVAFEKVANDRGETVAGVAYQIVLLVLRIGDRLAGEAFGQDLRRQIVEPCPEGGQYRQAVLPSARAIGACFAFARCLPCQSLDRRASKNLSACSGGPPGFFLAFSASVNLRRACAMQPRWMAPSSVRQAS